MEAYNYYHEGEDISNRNAMENAFYFNSNQILNTKTRRSKSNLTAEQIEQRRLAGIKSAEKRKNKTTKKMCSVETSVGSPFNSVENSVERSRKQNDGNKRITHFSVEPPLKSSVASPLDCSVENSVDSPFNSVENSFSQNDYEKTIQELQWQNEMLQKEIAKILNQKVGYEEPENYPSATPQIEEKSTPSTGLFAGTLRESLQGLFKDGNRGTENVEIIDLHHPLFPPHPANQPPKFLFEPWGEEDYERCLFFDGVEEENRKRWIKKKKEANKILFRHYDAQKREFNKALHILQPIENLGYNDLIAWCLDRNIGTFFIGLYRDEILKKIENYKQNGGENFENNTPEKAKNPFNRERKWVGEKYNFVENLVELGVEREMAEHWLEVRKSRNMTDNESIFNILEGEFRRSWEKFGVLLQECIEFSLSKNSGVFTFPYFSEHRELKGGKENNFCRKFCSPLEEVLERFKKIFEEK